MIINNNNDNVDDDDDDDDDDDNYLFLSIAHLRINVTNALCTVVRDDMTKRWMRFLRNAHVKNLSQKVHTTLMNTHSHTRVPTYTHTHTQELIISY